jgi:hypothetical protein
MLRRARLHRSGAPFDAARPGREIAPLTPAREHRLALAALALALAAFAAACAWLRVPLVDDAAISVAYGRALFAGAGPRITPHSQPVEAFSNPLWTFLLGLSLPLRLDPIAWASRLGVALAALSLAAAAAWGPCDRGGRALRLDDAAAAPLAGCVAGFAYWSGAGLETGLLALLLALSGALWLREQRTGRGVASAVALGLVCLTRPEGVLYAAAAGALAWSLRPAPWSPPTPRERRWIAALAAIVGAYLALRWWAFASLVANTYYAKRDADFGARAYLGSFARAHLALALALPLAAAVGRGRRAALAAVFLGAGALFVLRFRGDWMPEWRFLAPLAPCAGALLAAGTAGLRARHGGRVALLAAGALLVAAGVPAARRVARLRGAQEVSYAGVAKDARALGAHLRALGLRRPLLALPDVGGLALALPEAELMDPAMLADWSLARHGRSPALQDDYLRMEGPPAVIDVHGPSGYLARMPRVMALYAPIDPALRLGAATYVLRGLTATDDPRCPGGRAAVTAMPTGALAAAIGAADPVTALRLWRCAWSYRADAALPSAAWRAAASRRAMAEGRRREAAGRWDEALRWSSLATVLGGHDAHDRRRTEALRERALALPSG